jgi:ABC-type uncharacterized transport system substrate-binding protein
LRCDGEISRPVCCLQSRRDQRARNPWKRRAGSEFCRLAALKSPIQLSTRWAFLRGLQEFGYKEGQNLTVEREYANGSSDRLGELAYDLVSQKPDLIIALSTTAARPAKKATSTIPIVAIGMADPVADGLVASLARPGGNVTGTTFLGPELVARRLQLLQEVVPGLTRVAALWHPSAYSERTMAGVRSEIEVAARILNLQLQLVPATSPDDFVGAFAAMQRERMAGSSPAMTILCQGASASQQLYRCIMNQAKINPADQLRPKGLGSANRRIGLV